MQQLETPYDNELKELQHSGLWVSTCLRETQQDGQEVNQHCT